LQQQMFDDGMQRFLVEDGQSAVSGVVRGIRT
jgi:hypothetical protein